jgi:hypothetical protein
MDDEKDQRAEREGTVNGLRHHPVTWRHDDPVGGHQAEQHRAGQPDQREHPGVIKHEVLRGGINDVTGPGQRQHGYEYGSGGDRDSDDLPPVVASRSLCPRVHTLTTAWTADGRWHA